MQTMQPINAHPSAGRAKIFLLTAACIVAGLAVVMILVRSFSKEDSWVCSNGQWVKHGSPSAAQPTNGCSTTNTVANSNTATTITSFADCAAAGFPIQTSYPARCSANGQTFTEDIGNELEKTDLIQIATPRPNATITSPVTVTGKARGSWYFEGEFPVELRDADGKVLGTASARAQGEWMTQNFVNFTATLTYPTPAGSTGKLYLRKDNPSGNNATADQLIVPVQLGTAETQTVSIYLGKRATTEDSCTNVFPVNRTIPRTATPATAAVNQLLQGLQDSEASDGYLTSIPAGVTLRSLSIRDGVATADFNQALQQGVAGSCRVSQIRAQIEQTLKQFSSVQSVVISINDKTDDILQP